MVKRSVLKFKVKNLYRWIVAVLKDLYYFRGTILHFYILSRKDKKMVIKMKLKNMQDQSIYHYFNREAEFASARDEAGFKRHAKSCYKKTGFKYEDIGHLQYFFPL